MTEPEQVAPHTFPSAGSTVTLYENWITLKTRHGQLVTFSPDSESSGSMGLSVLT